MVNKDDLILRGKALEDLRDIKEMLVAAGDPFLANIMLRAMSCIENQPAVEAEPVKYTRLGEFFLEEYYGLYAICKECGAVNPPDNNYCGDCGRKVVKEEQPGGKD